jgi:tripartite-type tricarboxylate transporter receptor subunit TctC
MALAVSLPLTASAAWPEKPIRVILPWAPGGSTDIVGRVVAAELTKRLKQQVIIDNRAGAGGIVGMQLAAQTAPDGYNYMITSTAYGHLINRARAQGIDLVKSFAPVALLGFGDAALVVNPKLPVNSVKELIALAKSKPGVLNYASSGIGGFPHMNTELFKVRAGVDIVHIPFQSAGQAVADVMAGNTQIHLGSLTSAIGQVRSGRLKLLAVGGAKRNPQLPSVPTIAEAGVPGYQSYIWWGVFAPPKTPPALIARMHEEINAALDAPEVMKRLEEQGGMSEKMSVADFGKLMVSEQTKWLEVIKAANIKDE